MYRFALPDSDLNQSLTYPNGISASWTYGNRKSSAGCRVRSAENTATNLNWYTNIDYSAVSPATCHLPPAYDADGNQTLVTTKTGRWRVTYNGENRPVRWVRDSDNTTLVMSYDHMGRRRTKNAQRFFYDGYLQICNFHSQPQPSTSTSYFIWDCTEKIATRPLVWHRGNFAAYYVFDGNKNVSEVVAANGSLAAHYEYAPFGALTISRGVSVADNPWRFSSEYAEDDTATVYYNYRHYEPVTGRWMRRDPRYKIGGYNLYGFVKNRVFDLYDEKGTIASSIPSPHSNCEKYKDKAMESDLNKAMRKKLKDSGCDEPDVVCEDCCKYKGYYTPSENRISICEGKVKGDDEYDKSKDVNRTLYHELMHAYQKCKGADPNGCDNSICQEIDAYYNSTDFNGLGVYGETAKKEHVKSGVVKSASEACGCGKNDDACVKKIEDKFKKLYKTCRQKWNEQAESDK